MQSYPLDVDVAQLIRCTTMLVATAQAPAAKARFSFLLADAIRPRQPANAIGGSEQPGGNR